MTMRKIQNGDMRPSTPTLEQVKLFRSWNRGVQLSKAHYYQLRAELDASTLCANLSCARLTRRKHGYCDEHYPAARRAAAAKAKKKK